MKRSGVKTSKMVGSAAWFSNMLRISDGSATWFFNMARVRVSDGSAMGLNKMIR
jgi:hypothetical protein